MKKALIYLLFLSAALVFSGCFCIYYNIAGAQDLYYGSKYFRPYAQLKQEMREKQIIELKDHRILLLNHDHSELFDPYTKTSELLPGWGSINIFAQVITMTSLQDGNVLITKGPERGNLTCEKRNQGKSICPQYAVPVFDVKQKKIIWFPFVLADIEKHTINTLPDGNLLIVGGMLVESGRAGYVSLPNGQSYFENNISIYNPKNHTLRSIGHLKVPRAYHKTLLLNDKEALVFGGCELSGDRLQDLAAPYNSKLHSVELVNLETGNSEIIGRIESEAKSRIIRIDDDRFLLPQAGIQNGYIFTEVFNYRHPMQPVLIKVPILDKYMTSSCVLLPNKEILCLGEKAASIINIQTMEIKSLGDFTNTPLLNVKPIYIPHVGILVFGTRRYIDLRKDNSYRSIQIFNYERYLQDTRKRG